MWRSDRISGVPVAYLWRRYIALLTQAETTELEAPSIANPKIIPELNSIHSHLPPVGNKNSETISPMLAGEMLPNLGSGSREPVKESPEGNPTEDERERRISIGTHVNNDDSEAQSPREREESPQAPLDDVGAEVLRLRDQVQHLV